MRRILALASIVCFAAAIALGQTAHQPKVAPGANEPDWKDILAQRHGLSMFDDLLNPVVTTAEQTPGLFRKAGAGPVTYVPVIALGLADAQPGRLVRALSSRRRAPGDTALELRLQEHGRRPQYRQELAAAAGAGIKDDVRPWRSAFRPLRLQ